MENRTRIAKAPTCSASSSVVVDDLWFDILKRLPLKDILRCRCVCISWYSLVASPTFINEHLDFRLHMLEDGRNGGDLLLFREGSGNPAQKQAKLSLLDPKTLSSISGFFYCPIVPVNNPHFRVVGSVHGLICLLDDNLYNPAASVTLLWNPSVHRYIRLPQSPSHLNHKHHRNHLHFTFPRFTFNPINKDYLVVRVMYCYPDLENGLAEPPIFEFFSLDKHEWKTVPSTNIPPYVIVEDSCSQYRSSIDGAVFWIAWKKGSSVLFSFSAVDYELKTLSLPEQLGCSLDPKRSRVVEFRGFLSVMEVTTPMGVELAFNIWSCIDKGDQWCKIVSINTAVDGLRVRERSALMRVHRVTDDEKIIGARVRQSGNVQLLLFHPKTNQIDGLREYEYDLKAQYMCSYMQSLLLLDDKNRALSYDPSTIPRTYETHTVGSPLANLAFIYNWRRGLHDKYRCRKKIMAQLRFKR